MIGITEWLGVWILESAVQAYTCIHRLQAVILGHSILSLKNDSDSNSSRSMVVVSELNELIHAQNWAQRITRSQPMSVTIYRSF